MFLNPISPGVLDPIFEIEGSSFGLFLIFMCLRNHILQLRLYDQFSFFFVFLVPTSEGGGVLVPLPHVEKFLVGGWVLKVDFSVNLSTQAQQFPLHIVKGWMEVFLLS